MNMKNTRLLVIIPLAIIMLQIPAASFESTQGGTYNASGISASQIQSEDLELLVAVPEVIDVGEPIYVMVAGIRNAKAVYVKPISIRFELITNIAGTTSMIISNHFGYYNDEGNWVVTSGNVVDRLNDYIYFTTFDPFGYDALLSVRTTMEWMTPWHEKVTSVKTVDFTVGNWFNISSVISRSSQSIKESVLSKVDVGINVATGLIQDVKQGIESFQEFFDQMDILINTGSVDPSNLNFYIIDFIGTSADKGPLWEVAMNDLYSGVSPGSREALLDAKQAYTMQQVRDSFGILDAKTGGDTDASDGDYDYTITFVEDLYEWSVDDAAYLMNPSAPRSDTWDTQFVNLGSRFGNETGGSWAEHKRCSLEFLLEPITGAHADFKDADGADHNEKPPRKSVIMNTMGPYFPILNWWYDFYEIDQTDRDFMVKEYDELPVQTHSYGQYMVHDDTDIMKNYNRLVLNYDSTAPDGGTARDDAYNDMYDIVTGDFFPTTSFPIVNYSYYILKLAEGMADSFYYWINLGGGEPFSKMTRDSDVTTTISNGIHDTFTQFGTVSNTSLCDFPTGTFTMGTYTIPQYGDMPMFQLLDVLGKITNDRVGFSIRPKRIGFSHTEYYKIETGRWVDAFFNGTDISEDLGSLGDDNYITAREETGFPWWTPKAMCYSFMYEDTWAYYRLGGLTDYNVPNEYAWIPFVGPNKQVPIGWMTGPNLWFSVVGTYDIQMALEYLYGGIYMGYKEAVLNYKNVGMTAVIGAIESTEVTEAEMQGVIDLINDLDQAWYDLDLRLIDEIGSSILEEISKPRGASGKNIPQQVFNKLVTKTAIAYAVLSKGESDLSYVDNGLDTSGSDLELGDVGSAILELINGAIGPALELCQNMMTQVLSYISAIKNSEFESASTIDNALMTSIESGYRAVTDFVTGIAERTEDGFSRVGDTIASVATAINQTVHDATNAVVSWTADNIQKMGTETAARFNNMGNWVNDAVFDGLQGVTNLVRDASYFVLNGVNDTLEWVEGAIADVGEFVGDLAYTAGKAVGTVGGAVVGGAFFGPVGGLVGAGVGYAIGEGMGQGWKGMINEAAGWVCTGIDGFRQDVYTAGSTLIEGAWSGSTWIIQGGKKIGRQVVEGVSTALGVITDRSVDFVNGVGDAVKKATSFGADIAGAMGDEVKTFGSNIKKGINQAWGAATGMIAESMSWTKTQLTQVMEQNMATARTVLRSTKGNIVNVFNIVNLITLVMEQVSSVLEGLVEQVNTAFENVELLFNQTTDFLVNLAGVGIDIAVDFAGDLAGQLQGIETKIQQSTGFYTVMDTIYTEIKKSRTTAALLQYAQETMGTTKEIFFKWTDVFQPLANAKGGDTGFRIYQMGSTFADRLFFITTYMGSPVNVDTLVINASRIAMADETVPGNVLEASIDVYELFEDGDRVDGVYYISFSEANEYEWFGDKNIDPDPIKVENARPADYLLRSDANYTTPVLSLHKGKKLSNTWLEKTALFEEEFTEDAFPVMTILTAYPGPITAGQNQLLQVSVVNEMFSKPIVDFRVSMSTGNGFVISSRDITSVRLPSDEEGSALYTFEWTPLESTPSGTYNLLITIVEANGDTVTKVATVQIEATSILSVIVGWVVGIFGSILSFLGLGLFIVKKKGGGSAISTMKNVLGSMEMSIPGSCSADDVKIGSCTINGLGLDCDADTGKCKIRF